MNRKAKGARAERRAMKTLEQDGYLVTRSGASLGLFDLVAVGPADVLLVQVKAGSARLSKSERARIASLAVPAACRREIWRFPGRLALSP